MQLALVEGVEPTTHGLGSHGFGPVARAYCLKGIAERKSKGSALICVMKRPALCLLWCLSDLLIPSEATPSRYGEDCVLASSPFPLRTATSAKREGVGGWIRCIGSMGLRPSPRE